MLLLVLLLSALFFTAGPAGPPVIVNAPPQEYARLVQQRLDLLKAVLPLPREGVIEQYFKKDDWLVLDMVEDRHRLATQLALALSPSQRKQLFTTGAVHLKASELTPAQLKLARNFASHLDWITFTGTTRSILEFQWSPVVTPGTGPPSGQTLRFTLIDITRDLNAEERAELHEAVYGEPEEQEK